MLRRSYHLGVRTYHIREAVVLYIGLEAEDERELYYSEKKKKRENERKINKFLTRIRPDACYPEDDVVRSNSSRSESDERQAGDALSALAEVKQQISRLFGLMLHEGWVQVIRTLDLGTTKATVRLSTSTNHPQREVQDYSDELSFVWLKRLGTRRIMTVNGDVDLHYETRRWQVSTKLVPYIHNCGNYILFTWDDG
ncbi:hypothetical protein G5I_05291 [Acromyrmex echinatior]|uniref:Uncharacterized protein n=1 Tax=Acromyrmex echinatior TaxID=103372 RepID=F4WI22_ACREC|nr:hypothetical protein G5I_05291 [Acromyrmex echinatior]